MDFYDNNIAHHDNYNPDDPHYNNNNNNNWHDPNDPNNNNNNNNGVWGGGTNNGWTDAQFESQPNHYDYEHGGGSGIPDYWASRPGEVFERLTQPPVVFLFAFTMFGVMVAFARYVVLRRLGSFFESLCPICVRWIRGQKPPENYPNYFDTIPISTLKQKLENGSCKESLRPQYEASLKNRVANANSILKKLGKHDGKSMIGCHSYDVLDNKEYIDAFAMDSKCAQRRRLYSKVF